MFLGGVAQSHAVFDGEALYQSGECREDRQQTLEALVVGECGDPVEHCVPRTKVRMSGALSAEIDEGLRKGLQYALVLFGESQSEPVVILMREALRDAARRGEAHAHNLAAHSAKDVLTVDAHDDEHLSVRVLGAPGAKLVKEATIIDGAADDWNARQPGAVLQERARLHFVMRHPFDLLRYAAPLVGVLRALLRAGQCVEIDYEGAFGAVAVWTGLVVHFFEGVAAVVDAPHLAGVLFRHGADAHCAAREKRERASRVEADGGAALVHQRDAVVQPVVGEFADAIGDIADALGELSGVAQAAYSDWQARFVPHALEQPAEKFFVLGEAKVFHDARLPVNCWVDFDLKGLDRAIRVDPP